MSRNKKSSDETVEDVSVKARWKSGGFFTIPNRVYDKWGPLLGINGFAVYCALARYANNDTNEAWMKQSTIAQHLGCGPEVVGLALADIVELGLAERETHPRVTGFGVRHTYTLLPVEEPQSGTVAPRLRRKEEGKGQRAAQAEVEALLQATHIPPPSDTSLPSTGNTSLAKLEIPVSRHLKFQYNEDSLREEDSKEKQEARAAPVLSLLPGKENSPAPTNAPLPLTTFPEEPPPPAPSPPPSPMLTRTAGSSALAPAPAVEWDDLQAAPDSVRHGPITFPDDVDGWCQALIWLTTGWTATKFFATKPKAEHDKMWGQAKQHFKQGHSVPDLLDKYQPGGWWYILNAWKERRPTLHEISATWGDWEQTPVPLGPTAPPPANTREEWKPAVVQVHNFTPEQTAAMRQKFLQEAQNERERRNAERKAARQNGSGSVQPGARQ